MQLRLDDRREIAEIVVADLALRAHLAVVAEVLDDLLNGGRGLGPRDDMRAVGHRRVGGGVWVSVTLAVADAEELVGARGVDVVGVCDALRLVGVELVTPPFDAGGVAGAGEIGQILAVLLGSGWLGVGRRLPIDRMPRRRSDDGRTGAVVSDSAGRGLRARPAPARSERASRPPPWPCRRPLSMPCRSLLWRCRP